ncbi:MAG: hypothetical protein PWP11_836 [Thauera sp.]|nr:hypothetical protein [Thauera sp.]MDI3489559.1 hypothetical protein [Thauera sp.]
MAVETYYFGQGKVFSRPYNTSGAKWRWWGDVSALNLAANVEKVTHLESFSGNRGIVRDIPISKAMTVNATIHQLDTESLALLIYGAATTVAAGTVAAESLGTVAPGDLLKLAYGGVSSLVITDSDTVPVTIDDAHYELDARFGSIEIKTLPTSPAPVMPLKAAYSYSGGKQVNFLTQPQPIVEFRYEGINLAEGNAPVVVEFYKLATNPLQDLALITGGGALAGVSIECAVQIDSSKPATGLLGQFGRFLQLNAPATP